MFLDPHPQSPVTEWASCLKPGDVVLFRFPVSEDGTGLNAPKRRPCLVLDLLHKGEDCFVELAYGTASEGRANRGYEVRVREPQSRAIAGLKKPTRFICARRITVHIRNAGFFCPTGYTSPIIGALDETLMERLHALRARIQAEAEIAARYREEQQAQQARSACEALGFL
ncbi:hypothetical protein [Sulfitobacter sp.]|jgi:hypothetical protein|uniref:hypothetical protein n=1 Tax=Sulfitobacter sp. TaxID=1903071 RepID=UPI0039E5F053